MARYVVVLAIICLMHESHLSFIDYSAAYSQQNVLIFCRSLLRTDAERAVHAAGKSDLALVGQYWQYLPT